MQITSELVAFVYHITCSVVSVVLVKFLFAAHARPAMHSHLFWRCSRDFGLAPSPASPLSGSQQPRAPPPTPTQAHAPALGPDMLPNGELPPLDTAAAVRFSVRVSGFHTTRFASTFIDIDVSAALLACEAKAGGSHKPSIKTVV